MTAIASALYERLRTAPDFRFAIVGVEPVDTFRGTSQMNEPEDIACTGLVLENAIWIRAGMSARFETFRPGYVWLPYRRERFVP
jgi:hypothetical protein